MAGKSARSFRNKKSLGQHFLRSEDTAFEIACLLDLGLADKVLEIGPGQGILTRALFRLPDMDLTVSEFDRRLIPELEATFPQARIVPGDFLRLNLAELFDAPFLMVGNFPYQISTQIVMRMLEHSDAVPQLVGMFQREVAKRIVSTPGGREYGVISVFVQALYDCEYCMELPPEAFSPPPKVHSAVIRLTRKERTPIEEPALFKQLIKAGFAQRRKKLRNALKSLLPADWLSEEIFLQRAENLDYQTYEALAKRLAFHQKNTPKEDGESTNH